MPECGLTAHMRAAIASSCKLAFCMMYASLGKFPTCGAEKHVDSSRQHRPPVNACSDDYERDTNKGADARANHACMRACMHVLAVLA
eukprot:365582-Chlamydomonas_euryale.AAC.7